MEDVAWRTQIGDEGWEYQKILKTENGYEPTDETLTESDLSELMSGLEQDSEEYLVYEEMLQRLESMNETSKPAVEPTEKAPVEQAPAVDIAPGR